MELAVLDTREVLLDHLLAKVTHLCSSKETAKQILLEVTNNLTNEDILKLLQNEKALIHTLNKSKVYIEEKEELGSQLFVEVSHCESDLCAQITGMLLELDTSTIKLLLNDSDLLQEAIEKAKNEFIKYITQKKCKEEIGEEIYEQVCKFHDPNISSRITGMLLELDNNSLLTLLNDPGELKNKIDIAYEALCNYDSERS